jgi:class 3 adenylate cyclase
MLPFEAAAVFCSGTASAMLAGVLLYSKPRRAHTRRIVYWGAVHFLAAVCMFCALVVRSESIWFLHLCNALLLSAVIFVVSFAYRFPGTWNETEAKRAIFAACILIFAAVAILLLSGIVPGLSGQAGYAGLLVPPTICGIWVFIVYSRRRKLAARPDQKKFEAFAVFTAVAGAAHLVLQIYLLTAGPVWLYAGTALQTTAVLMAFRATGIHSKEAIKLTVKLLSSVVFIVFLLAGGLVPVAARESQRAFNQQRMHDIRAAIAELYHDDLGLVPEDVQYVAAVRGNQFELIFNRTLVSEGALNESELERARLCTSSQLLRTKDRYQQCELQSGRVRFVNASDPAAFIVYPAVKNREAVEVAFRRSSLDEYLRRNAGFGILLIAGSALIMTLAASVMYERMIFRPLQWLLGGIQRLNKGDLAARVRGGSRDELGHAIRSFNRMSRALRLRTDELQKNNERLDRDKRILQKFFSRDFLDQVLEEKISHNLGGERLPATILFLDIRNSTSIAEQIDPAVFSQFLSEIFTDVMDLVYGHHGSVNKLIGDGLLATFGCPVRTEKPALDAMHCALAVRDYMATFNDVRPDYLKEPVKIGIGIASGVVFAGNTGSVRRMEYTVLGDAVNIASRLESLTKFAGVDIFVDGATASQLEGAARLRRVRLTKVRGKIQEIEIFYLAGLAAPNAD